jgi:hypothetical protein
VSARAGVYGRRAAATLAAGSAVLHGISVGHVGTVAAACLMLVMAAACLYCAGELWTRGNLRVWTLVAVMNLAMIAMHLPGSSGHHHGGGVTAAASAHPSTAMSVATALAAVEVAVATTVLLYRTRGGGRRAQLTTPSTAV